MDRSASLNVSSIFCTANSLGWYPITSQFFYPVAPLTLALVAAAIHCTLLEYSTWNKITVIYSQDEYRGKFCTSTVIYHCISTEAMALVNCPSLGSLIPPMVRRLKDGCSTIPSST
jgi:exosortase/archaeosortase